MQSNKIALKTQKYQTFWKGLKLSVFKNVIILKVSASLRIHPQNLEILVTEVFFVIFLICADCSRNLGASISVTLQWL